MKTSIRVIHFDINREKKKRSFFSILNENKNSLLISNKLIIYVIS